MDPDATLKEMLDLSKESVGIMDSANSMGELQDYQEARMVQIAERLAELAIALDEWIKKGGFLPAAWRK